MSNELNNIISRTTDGVYEGVAIGGDRYPGTTFMDHIMRYQADPEIKMIVLLGEVGGVEEYEVCEALTQKKITKPLVAWCIGTCASKLTVNTVTLLHRIKTICLQPVPNLFILLFFL